MTILPTLSRLSPTLPQAKMGPAAIIALSTAALVYDAPGDVCLAAGVAAVAAAAVASAKASAAGASLNLDNL